MAEVIAEASEERAIQSSSVRIKEVCGGGEGGGVSG